MRETLGCLPMLPLERELRWQEGEDNLAWKLQSSCWLSHTKRITTKYVCINANHSFGGKGFTPGLGQQHRSDWGEGSCWKCFPAWSQTQLHSHPGPPPWHQALRCKSSKKLCWVLEVVLEVVRQPSGVGRAWVKVHIKAKRSYRPEPSLPILLIKNSYTSMSHKAHSYEV